MEYLTPAQCRAARALLDWSQPDLAKRCGMHVQTISAFENETGTPTRRTLTKITDTLEHGGIDFLPNEGVGKRKDNIIRYEGQSGFQSFMNDVYQTIKLEGGEICVSNVDETLFTELVGRECDDEYTIKMNELKKSKNFDFKILIQTGDTNTVASGYAEYRWID
ncbi:MAG: helix-turn-helix transcriptional regulator, partial [Pseudomonadota bacterium]